MTAGSLDDWKREGRYFDYRGQRIFSRTAGDARLPALLLIHGFPTASWDWEAVWPELARHYRVLAVDMIGFGFSDKPRRYDYSIVDQADLQQAFLRAHGVGDHHVLAHDYGDSVAQELLARQAGDRSAPRLRSVCFLNGGLFPETHRPLLVQRLLLSPLGPWIARAMTREKLAGSFTRIFGPHTPPTPAQLDAFWTLLTYNEGLHAFPRLIGYMRERRRQRERWVGALQRTSIPLKLIDGAADPISGSHMVERYVELVARPDVTVLDDIGHYPQVEAPDRVLRAYLDFRATIAER
jgi:pimeloyl-ACP methyl ester carboxylesterase